MPHSSVAPKVWRHERHERRACVASFRPLKLGSSIKHVTIDPSKSSAFVQWALLAVVSFAFAAGLIQLRLPAALLLGPMFAGIVFGTRGASVRVPELAYVGAQAVVGGLIAKSVTPALGQMFVAHGLWFVLVVALALVASSGLGVALSRLGVLPGTTAIWGVTPGAASAMVVLADAWGADARLVAFMQYLRVILVALAAAALARFSLHIDATSRAAPALFAAIDGWAFAQTLAVIGVGTFIGIKLRVAAGALLVPAALVAAAHLGSGMRVELPQPLLVGTYALLGWSIGLRFTREALLHAVQAFVPILLSMLVLIAICAGIACLLSRVAGVDLLTAYLATSPGGMDTVAIIAASSPVDVPFVMALQTLRLVIVMVLGPQLASFVASRAITD